MGNSSSAEGSDVPDGAGEHQTHFNDKLLRDFAESSGMTVGQVS